MRWPLVCWAYAIYIPGTDFLSILLQSFLETHGNIYIGMILND